MPIKAFARPSAYPRIGILRKGAPRPERGIGKDLEYFRFTADDPALVAEFTAIYGATPTEINIRFPYDRVDDVWSWWREEWKAGGLIHRCDGETMTLSRTPEGGYSGEPTPCPYAACAERDPRKLCRPVGRLSVFVSEFDRAAIVLVQTTSLWDILTIGENLAAVEELRGGLKGIPFVLRRKPRSISTPRPDGTRVRVMKSLLSVEIEPSWVRLLAAEMERKALPNARLSLPSPAVALPAPEEGPDVSGVDDDRLLGDVTDPFTDVFAPDDPAVDRVTGEILGEETEAAASPAEAEKAPAKPARPASTTKPAETYGPPTGSGQLQQRQWIQTEWERYFSRAQGLGVTFAFRPSPQTTSTAEWLTQLRALRDAVSAAEAQIPLFSDGADRR